MSHQEALDTSTPMCKAMFTIIAATAELERSIIRERITAGLHYAQLHGTKSGRPIGRPRAVFSRAEAIRLRAQGLSSREIAKRMGVSPVMERDGTARDRQTQANGAAGTVA